MTALRSTTFRYRRLASIAAGGLATARALSVAVRAWAQTSPDSSPAGACVPGRIVDFCSDGIVNLLSVEAFIRQKRDIPPRDQTLDAVAVPVTSCQLWNWVVSHVVPLP
jgi:hypothetical protein